MSKPIPCFRGIYNIQLFFLRTLPTATGAITDCFTFHYFFFFCTTCRYFFTQIVRVPRRKKECVTNLRFLLFFKTHHETRNKFNVRGSVRCSSLASLYDIIYFLVSLMLCSLSQLYSTSLFHQFFFSFVVK